MEKSKIMTKSILRMICVAIIVILTISCTVQKRLHQPGFHVEWRKPLKAKESTENITTNAVHVELVETTILPDNENVLSPLNAQLHLIEDTMTASPSTSNTPASKKVVPAIEKLSEKVFNKMPFKEKIQDPDIRLPQKNIEPVGIASFVLILLAIFSAVIVPVTGLPWVLWFLVGILAVAAFICAVYSLVTTKKYPKAFRKNGFGLIGFILSTAALGIGLLIGLVALGFSYW